MKVSEKINLITSFLIVILLIYIIFLIGIPYNRTLLKRKILPTGLYKEIRRNSPDNIYCAQEEDIPIYNQELDDIKMQLNDIQEQLEEIKSELNIY